MSKDFNLERDYLFCPYCNYMITGRHVILIRINLPCPRCNEFNVYDFQHRRKDEN